MPSLEDLKEFVTQFNTAPTLADMPHRTLLDKGIAGPTNAHVIEEIHTPFNLAYIAITTGSTAFQNIVGVTHSEIAGRKEASFEIFDRAGIQKGMRILFTYAPLVNVFSKDALEAYGISWCFLKNSSRDAFLLAMAEEKPDVVIGESSFLRLALEDAEKLGFIQYFQKGAIFLAAGTPLDLAFPSVASATLQSPVHDLYGCQEFGWLALDGVPVRKDITFIQDDGKIHLLVGGLSTGDCFHGANGTNHVLNPKGDILTYSRVRVSEEYETTVLATTAHSRETIERLAKTILRIKGKIVRVAEDLQLNAPHTILSVAPHTGPKKPVILKVPPATVMFDTLLEAQLAYQKENKTDPTWIKRR